MTYVQEDALNLARTKGLVQNEIDEFVEREVQLLDGKVVKVRGA